jgi:hypothetical protein
MEEAWAAWQRRLTAALLAALAAVLCLSGLLLRLHAQAHPLLLHQPCEVRPAGLAVCSLCSCCCSSADQNWHPGSGGSPHLPPTSIARFATQQTPEAAAGAGNGSSRLTAPPATCLFNSLLREDEVQWSEQPDGRAHQVSLRGCALRRFTHEEARQCLAGKRLVFLGDSVTRWVGLDGWVWMGGSGL